MIFKLEQSRYEPHYSQIALTLYQRKLRRNPRYCRTYKAKMSAANKKLGVSLRSLPFVHIVSMEPKPKG